MERRCIACSSLVTMQTEAIEKHATGSAGSCCGSMFQKIYTAKIICKDCGVPSLARARNYGSVSKVVRRFLSYRGLGETRLIATGCQLVEVLPDMEV